jgi:hypothetical protein
MFSPSHRKGWGYQSKEERFNLVSTEFIWQAKREISAEIGEGRQRGKVMQ